MIFDVQFPGLGLEFQVNRVAISLGGFNIYWYGVLIALGMVLAMAFAFHYADDFGINTDRLIDVVFVGTIMAVICARIYYVAFAPFQYESIWQMIDLRQGGIAIYGAVIGAAVFGSLAAKIRKVPILPLLDITSMGFLIGQCIGRWGNFVNQEAFGCNTTLPWGMYSEGTQQYLASVQATLAAEGVVVDPTQPVHPTFLYESIWCLLGFLLLLFLMKRRKFHGELALSYVIWYGMGRYVIEGLRTDSLMVTSTLRTSQLVALISVAVAVILCVYNLQKAKGTTLMVPLAVADIKKQAHAKDRFAVDELPAAAPHKEFAAATKEMNDRLDELDLEAVVELIPPEEAGAGCEPAQTEQPEPQAADDAALADPEDVKTTQAEEETE